MTDPDDITQRVVDQLHPMHAPRLARLIWLLYGLVVVLLAAVAFVWLRSAHTAGQVGDANRAAQQNAAALATANDRIAHLGGVPVSTPAPGPAGPPGPQGQQGPGPSDSQIATAVGLYCSSHDGCTGTPTRAEVAAAVTAYCGTGACTGPAGPSGTAGKDGQTGAQGPGPTDDQVQTAVVAYCAAHNGCTGPAGHNGADGSTGPTGPAGRGITSIDCTGLGVDQLTIHYSDGTSETVPCTASSSTSTAPTSPPATGATS